MKKLRIFLMLAVMLLLISSVVYGESAETIYDALPEDSLSWMAADESGNLMSAQDILQKILSGLFREITDLGGFLVQIIVIAVLTGFLATLESSFSFPEVSKIAFLAGYSALVIVAVRAILPVLESVGTTVERLATFMQTLLPIYIGFLMSGGNATAAAMMNPTLVFATQTASLLVSRGAVPLIFCMLAFTAISCLSEDTQLEAIIELMQSILKTSLVFILTVFIGILTVQGFVSRAADGVIANTARLAAEKFVPVVGGILSGAADTVLGSALVVKNACGVVGVAGLVAIAALPTLKLIAAALMFKLAAAVVAPITDKKAVKCLRGFSEAINLMFAVLGTVLFLFIIACAILLGTMNTFMTYR